MARQLKTVLEAKKNMRNCNECKCILLSLWRCSDEFCGCGEENNNSVNPNIQPSPAPAPAPSPAPAPTPIDPDDNNQNSDDNGDEPDYIPLDELNG